MKGALSRGRRAVNLLTANAGQRCRSRRPASRDRRARAATQPTRRATVPALEEILYQPLPVLDHGFVRVIDYMGDDAADRAGGARLLRPRHQEGQRGPGPHQLSDAPPPHDAVRDVRDQVPREAADLRGAPVDPPPHRQRERVFRALFDPRQRVLYAGARASRRAVRGQPPGPRRRARGRGGRARARAAARGCRARLRALRGDAERGRDGRGDAIPAARASRASWRA